jgi:phenylalanyl-tRNA synthetase beta chain
MKVSVSWIRNLNNLYKTSADPMPKGIDDLVEKIGAQLGAVEEVIDLGKRYEGIVVVEVVSCEKHPNADKLSLCFVDDGGVVKDVERNEQGHVQVVCGAPNVKAGLTVAWIPPGATVPSTYDKDPFVLEARELRGKVSNGMLASPQELALGDSHEGILVITEEVDSGTPFAKVYKLDDYIIDIENKMFTHRPDLFGQLGIAREIAGIYNHSFKSPSWYKIDAQIPESGSQDDLKVEVKNEIPELVPRFCLLPIKDIKVGPSPTWMQSVLSRIGVKSINNIVDLTNYYAHLTAQPSHAYDYDKLKALSSGGGAQFVIRKSKKGEKLKLLGGKEITLQEGAIMIATDKQAIGLGAVMGGAETEVDENTKNIVLEVANFDMNTIRRMSMSYGLFTDASTRFTKGQSPLQNQAVVAKLAEDVMRFAGGRVSGSLIDDNHIDVEVLKRGSLFPAVNTTVGFINERLGLSLNSDEIKRILTNVEIKVEATGEKLKITAPFWRTDIEIPEDVVEEVGRLYGYDKLPLELPKRDLTPAQINPTLAFKARLRDILSKTGANEVLTYSFVHGDLLDKTGQDKNLAFKLKNAISPDLHYYRMSLTPSLLEKMHPNIKAGFDEMALYEINKVHSNTELDKDGLPIEFDRFALILGANAKKMKELYAGAAFYGAKKYLNHIADSLGVNFRFEPLEDMRYKGHKLLEQMAAPYEPKRAASIFVKEKMVGVVGEYRSNVAQTLKLPAYCSGFELSLTALQDARAREYQPLNRFPSLEQDITLRSDAKMPYIRLVEFVEAQLAESANEHGYIYQLLPIDIFQKEEESEYKQTTWRIILSHPERTLTTDETNKLLDKIADEAKKKLNAERI